MILTLSIRPAVDSESSCFADVLLPNSVVQTIAHLSIPTAANFVRSCTVITCSIVMSSSSKPTAPSQGASTDPSGIRISPQLKPDSGAQRPVLPVDDAPAHSGPASLEHVKGSTGQHLTPEEMDELRRKIASGSGPADTASHLLTR